MTPKYQTEITVKNQTFTAYLIINDYGLLDVEIVNNEGITTAQLSLNHFDLPCNYLAIHAFNDYLPALIASGLLTHVETNQGISICKGYED